MPFLLYCIFGMGATGMCGGNILRGLCISRRRGFRLSGRYSALTRRSDVPLHSLVNCAPARCCVWPVLAPAQAFVRAGERRGNSGLGAGRFAVIHAGACGSIAGHLSSVYPCLCGAVEAISSARVWLYGSIGAFCCGSRLLFAAWQQTGRLAVLLRGFAFVHARVCGSVATPPSRAPGIAFLSQLRPRFAPGLCIPVAALPSARGWPCGSGGAVYRRSRRGLRFYCGVLPSFTPVFFPLSGKKRRLAVSCVSIPPGRDRHSCVLAALFGYLPLWVHFGFVRLFVAISTGYRGREERENGVTGLAVRPLCAFA